MKKTLTISTGILILLILTITKSFSSGITVKSDSVNLKKDSTENVYILTETQLRKINETYVQFDSLKVRFRELKNNSISTLQTVKTISKEISILTTEESRTVGIVLKNDKKIFKGLSFRIAWLNIRTPLGEMAMFYLGFKASEKGWIKF